MPRLFIAIDIPADIKEDIANICHGVPFAKWVELAQMHLTLQFLGEVDDVAYHDIVTALHGITVPPFDFSIKGVGHFPPRKDPKVLWVGIDRCDELAMLNARIEQALRGTGVKLEGRKFHPHITIARLKERTPLSDIADFLVANTLFRAARPAPASAFHLYSSVLNRDGAVHTKEEMFELEQARTGDRKYKGRV